MFNEVFEHIWISWLNTKDTRTGTIKLKISRYWYRIRDADQFFLILNVWLTCNKKKNSVLDYVYSNVNLEVNLFENHLLKNERSVQSSTSRTFFGGKRFVLKMFRWDLLKLTFYSKIYYSPLFNEKLEDHLSSIRFAIFVTNEKIQKFLKL